MGVLHERFLRRLKDLHDRRGIPWSYAPLLRQIAEAAPGPGLLPGGREFPGTPPAR
jgi:hypothetical protein